MEYGRQILEILSETGENGISVQNLATHIYNQNCSLFFSPDPVEVHKAVRQFLLRNSKSRQGLVEKTGKRGFYRLNTNNSDDARQLMLEFQENKEEATEEQETTPPDISLELFP
ncbi:MAG: hypothetical protein ACI4TW_03025 [Prevotella sp.]